METVIELTMPMCESTRALAALDLVWDEKHIRERIDELAPNMWALFSDTVSKTQISFP